MTTWNNNTSRIKYDFAINGMPFSAAITRETPYTRQTQETQKQQIDTAPIAGEQSLSTDYWYRSQPAFDYGVGAQYLDGYADPYDSSKYSNRRRAQSSVGVNLFDPRKVTLLRQVARVGTSTYSKWIKTFKNGVIAQTSTTDISYITGGFSISTVNWLPSGGSGTPITGTTDGTNIYIAASNGIYKTTETATNGVLLYTVGTYKPAGTGFNKIEIVKDRIIASRGNILYELPANNNTSLSNPTDPAEYFVNGKPLYDHPNTSFIYSAIADGPSCIYVAGYAGVGSKSYIYKIDIDADDKLGVPTIVAELSPGELIYSMIIANGTYIIIGTSHGIRIGEIGGNGTIVLGGLTINVKDEDASGETWSTGAITGLALYGDKVYANGWQGTAYINQSLGFRTHYGVFKIDLSQPLNLQNYIFPYQTDVCYDVQPGDPANNFINDVAMFGSTDRVAFGSNSMGLFIELAQALRSYGVLTTPRTRMDTLEDKWFKEVQVLGNLIPAPLEVYAREYGLSGTFGINLLSNNATTLSPIPGSTFPTLKEIQYQFVLKPNVIGSITWYPEFQGYQIKGLPRFATTKRLIQVPLLCFDEEKALDGSTTNRLTVKQRVQSLEAWQNERLLVKFQDFILGETLDCFIESVRFISNTISEKGRAKGHEGILLVTLSQE
jgi:hypothetical protein